MLRAISGKGRQAMEKAAATEEDSGKEESVSDALGPGELIKSWQGWIKRVTKEVVQVMGQLGIPDWAEEHYRRKWRWCGHVCRRTDGR